MPRRTWVKPFACPRSPLVQRFRSSNPIRRAQRSGLLRQMTSPSHTARYGRPPGATLGPGIHTVRYGVPECLRCARPRNDGTKCWSRNGRASPRNRSGKRNSLFRRRNSLFRAKNSLFFRSQGIRIQHIEVTNKFLVFANAQGICPQRVEMTTGIRAVLPKKPRIRKNSLLNSLF
jgi:hypothetical protein